VAAFATAVVGTASALVVSGAFVPGVTLTLSGLVVATIVIVLPVEILGQRIYTVGDRYRSRTNPALAGWDMLVVTILLSGAFVYSLAGVALADLASAGFDIDGVLAYFATTALVFVGEWGFAWMSPWRSQSDS
jgi:diacylglycerol kinase